MPLGLKFNSEKFTRIFIGKKATRWLQQLFDGLGRDNLGYLIKENKSLADTIQLDARYDYKALAQPYKDYAKFFTDKDVYLWIPDKWRDFIEAQAGGKDWAFKQLAFLRGFFFPS